MTSRTLENIEKDIRALKQRLARTGNMRPGTLSIQYRNPKKQRTPFHQISFTHQGLSRSQYVRPENLMAIKQEISTYRRFKSTVQALVALSIEASRLRHSSTHKT